ncbi:MAG: carbonic anhydrase [Pseudomonadota bacterium]
MITADKALERLKEGNRRFVAGESAHANSMRGFHPDLAKGQTPFATVLACSDSRVPTELIFDVGFGDLFVIRVAGNVVAPSQIGSVEYAASVLGARLVVVLGHSNCGAVVATLQELRKEASVRSPNLRSIVDRVQPAVRPDDTLETAITANVRLSVERLTHGSQMLEELLDSDDLTIVGAEYSIETGEVTYLE